MIWGHGSHSGLQEEGITRPYPPLYPSESVPSDIDTNVDENYVINGETSNDVWSVMDALTLLHVQMKSSLPLDGG